MPDTTERTEDQEDGLTIEVPECQDAWTGDLPTSDEHPQSVVAAAALAHEYATGALSELSDGDARYGAQNCGSGADYVAAFLEAADEAPSVGSGLVLPSQAERAALEEVEGLFADAGKACEELRVDQAVEALHEIHLRTHSLLDRTGTAAAAKEAVFGGPDWSATLDEAQNTADALVAIANMAARLDSTGRVPMKRPARIMVYRLKDELEAVRRDVERRVHKYEVAVDADEYVSGSEGQDDSR